MRHSLKDLVLASAHSISLRVRLGVLPLITLSLLSARTVGGVGCGSFKKVSPLSDSIIIDRNLSIRLDEGGGLRLRRLFMIS